MPGHILGIETSCDETSAAILSTDDVPCVEALAILSQDVHKVFGGVVPELASRAHLKALPSVVDATLADAGLTFCDIDGIAVTQGPGLIGALLAGVMYAKGLSLRLDRPIIGVHHLEGHLFAPTLDDPALEPPFVALLVSGGHTMLLNVMNWGDYELLGETRDDAAGEAFDKVGAMLSLPYPGGPAVERAAHDADSARFNFPRPMLNDGYDFSFSGLKTAVRRVVQQSPDLARDTADIAAGFQAAVCEVLSEKTARAVNELGYDRAVVGGGVACNGALAYHMRERLGTAVHVSIAAPRHNTDNAAMIARAGWFRLEQREQSSPDFDAQANLPLPGLRRREPLLT